MIEYRFLAATPEEAGIDSSKLEALFRRVQRDIDEGKLPSAQVAVARHGKVAALRSFGTLSDGTPATNQTLYAIFSATKGFVAGAIWTLIEDGCLDVSRTVSSIIPEFGSNGKENITVEQVMLHAGGFPYAPMGPPNWDTSEGRSAAFARWRTTWEPGSRFEYHPVSAHWVLAEIIERISQRDYRAYILDRITKPLGLSEFFLGLPDAQNPRVAEIRQMAPPVEPPGGWRGVDPNALLSFNLPAVRKVGIPGGGGISGAGEIALYYQALIHGGRGANDATILKPETIHEATRVRTDERHVDPLLNVTVNRALSVIVAGDDGNSHMRGFGKRVSPRAFGHNGAGGQIAWGDPETGISLGYVTNGLGDYLEVGRRTTAISSLAADCAL